MEGLIRRNELVMSKEVLTEKDPRYIDSARQMDGIGSKDIKVSASAITKPNQQEVALLLYPWDFRHGTRKQ